MAIISSVTRIEKFPYLDTDSKRLEPIAVDRSSPSPLFPPSSSSEDGPQIFMPAPLHAISFRSRGLSIVFDR